MTAVNERVLREENGTARPEDAPMGLVWIKSRQQDAASLGLQRASSAAYVHNGREQPRGNRPRRSSVIQAAKNISPRK